jgi:hypothetical protein
MIDPLIALGAAANIAQFINYGITIVAKSRDIHSSANGSLVEDNDLKTVSALACGRSKFFLWGF